MADSPDPVDQLTSSSVYANHRALASATEVFLHTLRLADDLCGFVYLLVSKLDLATHRPELIERIARTTLEACYRHARWAASLEGKTLILPSAKRRLRAISRSAVYDVGNGGTCHTDPVNQVAVVAEETSHEPPRWACTVLRSTKRGRPDRRSVERGAAGKRGANRLYPSN